MNTRYDSYDEYVVDTLLSQTGEHGHDDLRAALLDLRSFAHTPAGPAPVRARRLASLPRRRRGVGRRAAVTSLVVAATLGLGAGAAAAASPDFRETARQAVAGLVGQAPAQSPAVSHRTAVPAPVAPAADATSPAIPSGAPATAAPATPAGPPAEKQAVTPAPAHGLSTALTHHATPTLPPEAPLSGHVPPVRFPSGAGDVALPGQGGALVHLPASGATPGKDGSGEPESGGADGKKH